jgi:hypothetical protein
MEADVSAGPTDLDHQGAVCWARCEMCQAEPGAECVPTMLGDVMVLAPGPGRAHVLRLEEWARIKERVAAGAGATRNPNIQQIPRGPARKDVREGFVRADGSKTPECWMCGARGSLDLDERARCRDRAACDARAEHARRRAVATGLAFANPYYPPWKRR